MNKEKSDLKSRLVVPTLVLIFTAPMIVSFWLLNFTDFGRGTADASHGELIVPPVSVENFSLHSLSADSRKGNLHGKWSLVIVHNGGCDRSCIDKLYKIRQIRLASGKYAERIQRVMLTDGDIADLAKGDLPEFFPGQWALGSEALVLQKIFSELSGNDSELRDSIFLIDPLGNLMMRYEGGTEPSGIIKDLRRLLRYSRIG